MSKCKPHQANSDVSGYGRVYHTATGTHELSHRLAWIEKRGSIPDGMLVLHTCDNRACVQDDEAGIYTVNGIDYPRQGHLWLGTNQANMDDMYAKGRGTKAYGEGHGRAQLRDKDVIEIRKLYSDRQFTQATLAIRFGVTRAMIGYIVRRDCWKHI